MAPFTSQIQIQLWHDAMSQLGVLGGPVSVLKLLEPGLCAVYVIQIDGTLVLVGTRG